MWNIKTWGITISVYRNCIIKLNLYYYLNKFGCMVNGNDNIEMLKCFMFSGIIFKLFGSIYTK